MPAIYCFQGPIDLPAVQRDNHIIVTPDRLDDALGQLSVPYHGVKVSDLIIGGRTFFALASVNREAPFGPEESRYLRAAKIDHCLIGPNGIDGVSDQAIIRDGILAHLPRQATRQSGAAQSRAVWGRGAKAPVFAS